MPLGRALRAGFTLAAKPRRGPMRTATQPQTPSWARALAVNQWAAIPGTALSSVAPFPTPYGSTGPSSKISAWCGATLKRSGAVYLIGAAGGHQDYAGNEVNALTLSADAPAWSQLRAPTANSDIIGAASPGYPGGVDAQFFKDLRPSPTHTYYATQFIESQNRMVVVASPGWTGNGQESGNAWPTSPSPWYVGSTRSFVFNMATGDWEHPDYFAAYTGGGDFTACLCCKHPTTDDIYYYRSGSGSGLRKWTAATNSWSTVGSFSRGIGYCASAVDPTRNRILFLGQFGTSDLAPGVVGLDGVAQSVTFGGLGASALTGLRWYYGGVLYDEANDRFLAFTNENPVGVVAIDAGTLAVSNLSMTGTIPAGRPNGMHNSAQYVPDLGGISGVVVANSYSGNVQFLRTA